MIDHSRVDSESVSDRIRPETAGIGPKLKFSKFWNFKKPKISEKILFFSNKIFSNSVCRAESNELS